MSAVLFRQCLGNAAGRSATFSKTEMQHAPKMPATFSKKNLQQRINESIFYDPFNLILVKEMKMRLLEKNNSGKRVGGAGEGGKARAPLPIPPHH
jgi:hypothetical protein